MAPGELSSVLSGFICPDDADLLVGFQSSDDAAVYRIDEKRCLLSTTDFFPPMIADARDYGAIAAANALSDIYSMGGRPLYALNLVCFPQGLDQSILREILAGGMEKCIEAGAALAGGHTIYDNEIKYGLAVTGIADIDKVYRNNTPRPGDALILTKPLGSGVITAAHREGDADPADTEEVVASMRRLNKYAAGKLSAFDIGACTDVTGFGLAGHALEMTCGNVSAEIYSDSLPYFSGVRRYIEDGYVTGGGRRNRLFAGDKVDTGSLPAWLQELVFDPQTSGGLLIAVKAEQADDLLSAIRSDDPRAEIIGRIIGRAKHEIVIR